MEIPFPYGESQISESHIYMPQTTHSSLLENDAEHSIAACFLYTATNRNPDIIQTKLAQLYGGQAWEYPILAISTKTYLVSLPEFLDINQVLSDLLVWSVLNHIHVWRWDHEEGWNPTPPGFMVYLEVLNYPLQLWRPTFFHILVSDFGVPLYVDEVNSLGNDRSSLRIAVSCVDPARIPHTLLLIYDGKWRRCSLSILGWSYSGRHPLEDHGGSSAGGLQSNVQWPSDINPQHTLLDQEVRAQLSQARGAVLRREHNRFAAIEQFGGLPAASIDVVYKSG